MSKLSPLGQSMASLFTPESERLRAGQKQSAAARGPGGSFRLPGMALDKGEKPGDSLGNPGSPGYESWGKKKQSPAEDGSAPGGASGRPAEPVVQCPTEGPELIRLRVGWDKLLVAQKKLCEKAKQLFTLLEGPGKYSGQRRARILELKNRGCIVDLDIQETQDQLKEQKAKEPA